MAPGRSGVVYITTGRGDLLKSEDGARTFRSIRPFASDLHMSTVLVAESDPNVVYVGTQKGILRSHDAGATWEPLKCRQCIVSAIDPTDAHHLYGAEMDERWGEHAFAVSHDGGDTWKPMEKKVGSSFCYGMIPREVDIPWSPASGVYVWVDGPQPTCAPFDCAGVYLTRDDGATWSKAWEWRSTESVLWQRQPAETVTRFTAGRRETSSDGGKTWAGSAYALPPGVAGLGDIDVDAEDSSVLYAIGESESNHDWRKLLRSGDGGLTWQVLEKTPWGQPLTLATDSVKPGWIYLSTWQGFYSSRDGGKSWLLAEGLWDNQIYTVTVDPTDGRIVYAGNARGELFRSEDTGVSWRHADRGLPRKPVWDIVIEATRPARLIVGTGDCVWRSEDAGASWTRGRCIVPAGMYPPPVQVYELAKLDSDLWAAASQLGVLLSPDDARSWLRLYGEPSLTVDAWAPWELLAGSSKGILVARTDDWCVSSWCCPPKDGRVQALATDRRKPRFMALSLVARSYESREQDLGLWKTDEGSVGYCLSLQDDVLAIAVSPGSPYVLYAGAREHGLQVSFDQGLTWVAGGGLDRGSVFHIALDSLRPEVLYAATDRGVFVSRNSGISWMLTLDSARFPIREDLPPRNLSREGPF